MFQQIPATKRSFSLRKLILGVGINDADYVVRPRINAHQLTCPFYQVWVSMLARCYNPKLQARRPTYVGCTVVNKWLTFSNFKKWMIMQVWEGSHLDKDILDYGNKIYSAETCVFVSQKINSLLNDHASKRGKFPVGVNYDKSSNKYKSQICSNGKHKHIGLFVTPELAHIAYVRAKSEEIIKAAQSESWIVKKALIRIANKL